MSKSVTPCSTAWRMSATHASRPGCVPRRKLIPMQPRPMAETSIAASPRPMTRRCGISTREPAGGAPTGRAPVTAGAIAGLPKAIAAPVPAAAAKNERRLNVMPDSFP